MICCTKCVCMQILGEGGWEGVGGRGGSKGREREDTREEERREKERERREYVWLLMCSEKWECCEVHVDTYLV